MLAALAQNCGAGTGRGWGSHETDSQASKEEKSGKEEAEEGGGGNWMSPLLLYEKGLSAAGLSG